MHLQMPCCGAGVVLKRSRRSTQFFAHRVTGNCSSAPETEAHLRMKAIAVEVAKRLGWDATTEASGGDWRADVLVTKGRAKVAFEVQWSPQSDEETFRRQERYKSAGVRCLWLFRQADFPNSPDIPAARIVEDDKREFVAVLGQEGRGQRFPLAVFLEHALSRRLSYKIPVGIAARCDAYWNDVPCWKCREISRVLAQVNVVTGRHVMSLHVGDFDWHEDLAAALLKLLPTDVKSGPLKRKSRAMYYPPYLSNSCCNCGAILNVQDCLMDGVILRNRVSIDISLTERWRRLLKREPGWAVYE